MSYFFLLKRFEIWLLLGIVVALLVFAFQPVEEPLVAESPALQGKVVVPVQEAVEGEPSEETASEPDALAIREVTVEPTEGGQVVAVTLLARSLSGEEVEVSADTLTASTGSGIPVPHFFAPFQPGQKIASEEPSLVTVKFWLAEATDSIWVDFEGKRAKAELPGGS